MPETEQTRSGTGWIWLAVLGLGGVAIYKRVELRAEEKRAERRIAQLEAWDKERDQWNAAGERIAEWEANHEDDDS